MPAGAQQTMLGGVLVLDRSLTLSAGSGHVSRPLAYTLFDGEAVLTRPESRGTPGPSERLRPGSSTILIAALTRGVALLAVPRSGHDSPL